MENLDSSLVIDMADRRSAGTRQVCALSKTQKIDYVDTCNGSDKQDGNGLFA